MKILEPADVICLNTKNADGKQPPQQDRVYSTDGVMTALTAELGGRFNIVEPVLYQKPRGNNTGGLIENVSPTITSNAWQENVLLCEPSGVYTECSTDFQRKPLPGISRTLKAEKHDSGVTLNGRIRKLTPLECYRLMGFDDEDFYKAKYYWKEEAMALLEKYPKHFNKKQHRQFTQEQRIERISNSQLYKQAGNSIIVNVLEAIFGQMIGG